MFGEIVERKRTAAMRSSLDEIACTYPRNSHGAMSDPFRSTKATLFLPLYLSLLAKSYAGIGQLDEAWRCFGEAMSAIETTKERWFEADANRIAGEIALQSPERDTSKAEDYFERALSVARQQQAKSWELRASMSLVRSSTRAILAKPVR